MKARLTLLLALAIAAPAAGCSGTTTTEPGTDGGLGRDGGPGVDAWVAPGTDAGPGVDAGTPDVDAWVDPGTDAGGSDVDAWVDPGTDAGTPTVGPDVVGPYTVTMSRTMLTGTPAVTAVAYVPTVAAGEHVPLVMFKHGFQLASSNYAVLLQRIATHGFVVIGVDTSSSLLGGPTNVDERDAVSHTIDWALGAAPFASIVDGTHIAVMGHSRGGKVATLVAAADHRVTAALLLDPVNGCGPGMSFSATCPDATSAAIAGAITAPVGVMGETNDGSGGFMPCAPTAQNFATFTAGLTASSWRVQWQYTDAVHMTFTDDGGGFAGSFCHMPPANEAMLRDDIHAQAVAFARYHLRGDASVLPWLTGAAVPAGIVRTGP